MSEEISAIIASIGEDRLVQDIFDTKNYPNTYYNPKRPLDPEKISPTGG